MCAEDAAGEGNVRYIHNRRYGILVHEQKDLEYVTKIKHDMRTADLFNIWGKREKKKKRYKSISLLR